MIIDRGPAIRASALGVVSGLRTFTGLAALTLRTGRGARQPEQTMGRMSAKVGISSLAAQELIMDKLPATPDRKKVLPAAGRLIAGGLCGYLTSRRSQLNDAAEHSRVASKWAPYVGFGLAGALLSTALGPLWRAIGSKQFGVDAPAATAEDLVAIIISWAATRMPAE